MKNSSDTIGNRSRELPACSAVPQTLHHRVPPSKQRTELKLRRNNKILQKISLHKCIIGFRHHSLLSAIEHVDRRRDISLLILNRFELFV
jgi:hypothetical protein